MILLFFLAEKGLLKEFEENLRDEYYLFGPEWVSLSWSFAWSETKQGWAFWHDLDNEYREFLRSEE